MKILKYRKTEQLCTTFWVFLKYLLQLFSNLANVLHATRYNLCLKVSHIKKNHTSRNIFIFFIKKVAKVVPGFYNFGPLRIFLHCVNTLHKIVVFMSNFGPLSD